MKTNKIHVAFGFHVNCYHSYRGDTNDRFGFGSDIRIIRKIISTLDSLNENGIPVKGTWDIENFFSLEQILPEYAPDIIDGIKNRVEKYGDENIIMGYNNGALSAMNPEEFEASVERAITNKNGSGLKDIFGKCEKIVRPQEVMFTPSQVSLYNKLNVRALCLYYSAIPFDAFRTIIPKLPDEEAFNPLTYTYKGESMTIIPTYSNADVMDAGCLRAWVKELHSKQASGEINSDLFIFINMDADAILWETIELPLIKGKIANTDGIHGLVKEVADLDYVKFDTPGRYLDAHEPVGRIEFTHDTADGNFTGYASWAEKPFNRQIWTRLERSRAMAKLSESDFLSPSFDERVLLLSTTHFGLATPVLNISREKKALELSDSMLRSEYAQLQKYDKLTVYNINNSCIQCVQLKKNGKFNSSQILVNSTELSSFACVDISENSVFLMMKFNTLQKKYTVDVIVSDMAKETKNNNYQLNTENSELKLCANGKIDSVSYMGKTLGNENFLKSYITYAGKKYYFEYAKAENTPCSGGCDSIKVSGEINLPGQIKKGAFEYVYFTVPFSDGIFLRSTVNYPLTDENYSISTENSSLGRFTDISWEEAVPLEITPSLKGNKNILKRNFMEDVSSFTSHSFVKSDPINKKLDSFNHQLTGGVVGLSDAFGGIMVANSRQILGSMAHCPMRLDEDGTVHMNMFGTYYGNQRHHWSRTNGSVLEAYNLATPQAKSIAPSYNGNCETAVTAFFMFENSMPDEKILAEITAFADGAVATANEQSALIPFTDDNVSFHSPKENDIAEKKLKSPALVGNAGVIKTLAVGSKAIINIIKCQLKSRN